MRNILNNKSQGQLLIEALVAISVLMIGTMAVFGVLSQSLSLNRVAADQYVAANLASEGVEIIKNLVDSGYDSSIQRAFTEPVEAMLDKRCAVDINTVSGDGCTAPEPLKFTEATGFYSIDGDSPTKFLRYAEVSYHDDPIRGEYMEVHSTVEWGRRGGVESTITVTDTLYNWRRA